MGYLIVSRQGLIGQTGFFQSSISWQKNCSDSYESKSWVMIGYPINFNFLITHQNLAS